MQTNDNNNDLEPIKAVVQQAWEDQGLTVDGRQVEETCYLADAYCFERYERFDGEVSLELGDIWYARGFEVADLWTV